MKKLLLILTLSILFTVEASAIAEVFYDVPESHWAYDDVNYAVNTLKIFKGYGDLSFRPDNNITRAEFITALSKTMFKFNIMTEIYTSDLPYSDMSIEHWSYTYVISLYEHMKSYSMKYGLTDVFSGNKFMPEQPITREEAVALIAVFAADPIYDTPIIYTDIDEDYKYLQEVKRLSNSGIVTGFEDNTFRGNVNITRAQAAALTRRIYDDILTTQSENYLNRIEFMHISGEDMFSYFGEYDFNTTDALDKKYIKAKNTLEYMAFGGYVFPEDAHLYDLNAIDTMLSLRSEGYHNVAGVNFYLLGSDKVDEALKPTLANELLTDAALRNDLRDSEMMQLYVQIIKYNVPESLYMSGLKTWYYQTTSINAKANILFYRYAYYVKTRNIPMLRTMLHNDMKKSNNMSSILEIDWYLTPSDSVDFNDYSYTNYSYAVFKDMTLTEYMENPLFQLTSASKVAELNSILLISKASISTPVMSSEYESIFYKYSLNRAYVLNFINEKERAFAEVLNDYEAVMSFKLYSTDSHNIDISYRGTLRKLKYQ